MTGAIAVKIRYARIRLYKRGIRRLMNRWDVYLQLPDWILKKAKNPFEDGEIIRVEITGRSIILRKIEWWELLDWSKLPETFKKLPNKSKRIIFEMAPEKAKQRMIKKGLMSRFWLWRLLWH